MTRIDFYILEQKQASNRNLFVCRLLEKIYKKGHQSLVHLSDLRQAQQLDDLLWTWRQGSFIPHEIGNETDGQSVCPILINYQSGNRAGAGINDVLVNLTPEIPQFFSSFDRVVEVVDNQEQNRKLARERYRFYQQRGYPLETHEIRA